MFPSSRLILSILFLVLAAEAQAQVCITPGQPFECFGLDCDVTAGETSGQEAEVVEATNRLRVRAQSSGAAETSYAEVFGVVIEPDEPLFVRANVAADYIGFLTGFGGGPLNFGELDVRAVIRNLDTGELVQDIRIERFLNEGGIGMNGPVFFDNTFQPPIRRDVPFVEDQGVLLEAGQSYGVGLAARARADGGAINPAEANYFTANNGVFLASVRLITWPDLSLPEYADDDGDNLPNVWETDGIRDCNGNVLLDLPGFGAQPDHKDLFVEMDWLDGREPSRRAIATVKESFARAPSDAGGVENPDGAPGINLWVDTGSETDDAGNLLGDNLGGGNEIEDQDIPDPLNQFVPPLSSNVLGLTYSVDIDGDDLRDFYEVKAANFDLIRTRIFRYNLSARPRNDVGNTYPGGQAEVGGDDSVSFSRLPVVLFHELGHNLGLEHGGDDTVNCKPNYVSVMSYSQVPGIGRRLRDSNAQDMDNDGTVDLRTLDFSPPIMSGLARGVAPIFSDDEGLDENALSEFRELDEIDNFNFAPFFLNGDPRLVRLDQNPDWDGGGNDGAITSSDVNATGTILGCATPQEVGLSVLEGHDDWTALQLPIRLDGIAEELAQNETDETPVPETPEPTEEEIEDIEEAFGTVDLSIAKSIAPDLVMAGQEVTFEIEVTNAGPNPALEAIVEDTFSELVTPVDLPEFCEDDEDGTVTCLLDAVEVGDTVQLTLTGRVAPRLPCGEADSVRFTNVATVRNGDFEDTAAADNEASAEGEALCLRFEYAAKFTCGMREDGDSLLVNPGRYTTIVNVHNFQSATLPFFKKLALTFPPREQAAGDVFPIGLDELGYDEALKADCDDIRERVFDGELPEPFIEGYLIVQSPRRLDVDAFYTAGSGEGVRTLHIEEVTERDLRTALSVEKTSLVVPLPQSDFGSSQFSDYFVLYTVTINNDGGVPAEGLVLEDVVTLTLGGPVAGFFIVLPAPIDLPEGSTILSVTGSLNPQTTTFEVGLPNIAADSGLRVRFLVFARIYESDAGNPSNAALLSNLAEVTSQGPDTNPVDDVTQTLDDLLQ